MELVWNTQRGKVKGKRTIFLVNFGSSQEVPTSWKRGYKTSTLPQDFWRSLLREYLDALKNRCILDNMFYDL